MLGLPETREVYYIGLIDFLIEYKGKKKMEGMLRGGMVNFKEGAGALSVTSPDLYADRMIKYITSKTDKPTARIRRSSMVHGA